MKTRSWTLYTDDETTLMRMVRNGYVLGLELTFSWQFFRFVYKIETYGL